MGDAAGVQRSLLLAELELQRRRLAALAEWLLEAGHRGEGVAALHIADGIERVAAHLAT